MGTKESTLYGGTKHKDRERPYRHVLCRKQVYAENNDGYVTADSRKLYSRLTMSCSRSFKDIWNC